MISLVTLAVVAAIAGKPVGVVCDADTNLPPGLATPPPGFVIEGWAQVGGDEVHLHPTSCDGLNAPVGSEAFAWGLAVLIHEGAHARGIRSEPCSELWANLVSFDILRRFYAVPFFTPHSTLVGAQIQARTLQRPPAYWPVADSCS